MLTAFTSKPASLDALLAGVVGKINELVEFSAKASQRSADAEARALVAYEEAQTHAADSTRAARIAGNLSNFLG